MNQVISNELSAVHLARHGETGWSFTVQHTGSSDLSLAKRGERNPRVLQQIASATGGEAFFPEQTSAVVRIYEGIAADVRNQCTVGYVLKWAR